MPDPKKTESAEEPLGRGHSQQAHARVLTEARTGLRLRLLFWCLAIALGALELRAHRNDVNPDSISYIEMAETAAQGGWHALVNGYWSPLYPLLLSLGIRLFQPAIHWEFTFVHMVNFVLYLGDLFCFEIFLKELLAARRTEGGLEEARPVPEKIVWICGYLLFLWSTQFWLGLRMVNPDMIVAGLVYLATALLLRISRGKRTWFLFAGFGVTLGAAYVAKTAMFPVSLAFLVCAFLLCGRTQGSYANALARAALATAVFLAVALPLVVAISKDKRRATFGDSGKINYAEYVNGATLWTHWQGEPPGTGYPAHPTRKISSDPPVYEFAQPIAGSYPPWYDPSYWYEGIRPHFSLKGQLWALFRSANLYLKLFSRSGALYVACLALVVQVGKAGKWDGGGGRMSLVWLPSLAALTMYALVHLEQRHVSAFVVVLLMGVLSSARVSTQDGAIKKRTVLVAILALALAMAWPVARDLRDTLANRPYEPWQVAVGLHNMGISPGARVGSIGTGLSAYWAHLARVKIIAEVPEKDQPSFLAAGPTRREEALRKLSELGVKAVVMKNSSAPRSTDGWQEIDGTDYYVWRPAGH